MKALAARVLTLTALVAPTWTGTAHAAPFPSGLLCGLAAQSGPLAPTNMNGVLFGGPLVFTDDTESNRTYTGRIVCSVHVNGPTHATGSSSEVPGIQSVSSVAVGTASYQILQGDNVYVCTRAEIGSMTLYWADSNDPLVEGSWSTDPNAPCALTVSFTTPSEDEPPSDTVMALVRLVDDVICPVLAIVFPPRGDVGILWDCPPYAQPTKFDVPVSRTDFLIPASVA